MEPEIITIRILNGPAGRVIREVERFDVLVVLGRETKDTDKRK